MADQTLHFLSPADTKILKQWIRDAAHANRPPGGSDGGEGILYYTPDVYLAKFPEDVYKIDPNDKQECELNTMELGAVGGTETRTATPVTNSGDGSPVTVVVFNPYTATFMPQGYFPVHRLASGGYVCDRPSGLRKGKVKDSTITDAVAGIVEIYDGSSIVFELEDVISQMGDVEANTMCTVGMVDGVDSIVTAKCDPEPE